MITTNYFISKIKKQHELLKGNYSVNLIQELGDEVYAYYCARTYLSEKQERALRILYSELYEICEAYTLDPFEVSGLEQNQVYSDISNVIERVYGALEQVN